MEETRTSLQAKLETLEQQVVNKVQDSVTAVTETVESVKAAVQDTVDTVKDTVQDTVDTVKDTVQGTVDTVRGTVQDTVDTVKSSLDISEHVQRHPWAMLLGSAAVGYVGTCLLERSWSAPSRTALPPGPVPTGEPSMRGSSGYRFADHEAFASTQRTSEPVTEAKPASKAEAKSESWFSTLNDMFGNEIAQLKGLAIGTVLGVAREMLTTNTPPPIGQELGQMIDTLTTKLGGRPIHASFLGDLVAGGEATTEGGNGSHQPSGGTRATGTTAPRGQESMASSWRS